MVQRTKSEGTASRVVTAPVYGVYFDYTGTVGWGGGFRVGIDNKKLACVAVAG